MARKNDYHPFNGLRGIPLTEREITVMRLYSRDSTIPQIAQRIFKSESTVRSDLRKVINKLGASNITCACTKACKLHIV